MNRKFIQVWGLCVLLISISRALPAAEGSSNARPAPVTSSEGSISLPPAEGSASGRAQQEAPCRWWQWGGCHEKADPIEGLPDDAPRAGTIITVDTTHNTAYLFKDATLVAKGPVATGSDKLLVRGLKKWLFRTPRGRHTVLRKVVDPVWTKPDWAFVEAGLPIPPIDSPKRKEKGTLGKYALDLGDGIMIHGTKDLASLGKKASHGCIRVGPEMLELIYQEARVGTEVYIF